MIVAAVVEVLSRPALVQGMVPRMPGRRKAHDQVAEDLIDRIYESALIPEQWTNVLEGMNRISASSSNSLFIFSERFDPRGISTDMTSDLLGSFLMSDDWRNSPSVRWTIDTRPSQFSSVDEVLTPEQTASDAVWAPLAARGFGQRLATVIPLSSGDQVTFVLARMRDNGRYRSQEISALNALRPHLHRATLIASRLRLERARTMTETLANVGLAAAVIGATGRVIGSNAQLDALQSVLSTTAFGRIAIRDRAQNALFRSGLELISSKGAPTVGVSIPIPAGEGGSEQPLLIHLLPVCGAAHDIFAGGETLMVVSSLERKAAPSPEVLFGLFDLSPAEARLVGELATGMTLRDIVSARTISMATLRTQMRSVLAKTGVPRMTALSHLLAQIPDRDRRSELKPGSRTDRSAIELG